MQRKISQYVAQFFSIVGHPLLSMTLVIPYLVRLYYGNKMAMWLCLMMLCVVVLPITIHNYIKYKNGKYQNFDVSNRKERRQFYPIILGLILLLILLLYLLHWPFQILVVSVVFGLMIFTFAICNLYVKASLHTGVNTYLVALLLHHNVVLGVLFLLITLGVAWSRWFLKAHVLRELLIGFLIGVMSGLISCEFL